MMQVDAEGAYFSEKPVPFYRTAWCYIEGL
jgi:hypothetical protein